jgi:hypothetical protein
MIQTIRLQQKKNHNRDGQLTKMIKTDDQNLLNSQVPPPIIFHLKLLRNLSMGLD